VNSLGKHPTVSAYHTTGHFQRKNQNARNSNNSESTRVDEQGASEKQRRDQTVPYL